MGGLRVVHSSEYTFDAPVNGGWLELRLRPRESPAQRVSFHQLVVRPSMSRTVRCGPFGNEVSRLEWQRSLQRLEVHATSELVIQRPPPPATTPSSWSRTAMALAAADSTELRGLTRLQGERCAPLRLG